MAPGEAADGYQRDPLSDEVDGTPVGLRALTRFDAGTVLCFGDFLTWSMGWSSGHHIPRTAAILAVRDAKESLGHDSEAQLVERLLAIAQIHWWLAKQVDTTTSSYRRQASSHHSRVLVLVPCRESAGILGCSPGCKSVMDTLSGINLSIHTKDETISLHVLPNRPLHLSQ